ncbi:hypothetical protein JD969_04345 [Planctomycetota bacterium]|nr:hypothetical protein JD969_04345 [Planctomycetota bacterium]
MKHFIRGTTILLPALALTAGAHAATVNLEFTGTIQRYNGDLPIDLNSEASIILTYEYDENSLNPSNNGSLLTLRDSVTSLRFVSEANGLDYEFIDPSRTLHQSSVDLIDDSLPFNYEDALNVTVISSNDANFASADINVEYPTDLFTQGNIPGTPSEEFNLAGGSFRLPGQSLQDSIFVSFSSLSINNPSVAESNAVAAVPTPSAAGMALLALTPLIMKRHKKK